MKFTNKEHDGFMTCPTYYEITYKAPHGEGVIKVKTKYYDRFIKKFTKAFKDATIISFIEKRGLLE